ncbi:caskin-1-like, partial [Artemia franciscana]|uniref:caskin-1-like n=1 Tax=Artemia franciscana TaxID=6661 RepID=UPI0032DAB32E
VIFPLHVAAWTGNTQTVECLLKSGPDINIRNNYGETPLYLAALKGHTETVECLIQSGADLNINCRGGKSPLHVAAWKGESPLHKTAWKGHTQTVECLLKYGAYVNSKDKDGMTALHYASWCGDKECVATLLEHGSDIDITNRYGHTAFDVAVVDDTAVYFASHMLKLRVANLYVSERNIRLSDKTQTSYPANELKDQL